MDWIIWLVVIVVIVAVVWWLLKRNSRASSGSAGTGSGTAAAATAPAKETPAATEAAPTEVAAAAPEAPAAAPAPAEASAAAKAEPAVAADKAEWETQWSETPPAEPHPAIHTEGARSAAGAHGAHVMEGAQPTDLQPEKDAATAGSAADSTAGSAATAIPVHHREYTEPHAPTLPGAESAAAEATFAADAGAAAEPAGHLALEQPYGEGSAASAADGSGPQGFTVKGSAASMIYYDETSPVFEETRAEVWFVSIAHAEAAGFRPPRRSRQ
jgi:hypothetical protein